MSEQKSALLGLIGVSLLWGCNYVVSAYLLRYFSPVVLSCARICMTSLFLLMVAFRIKGLSRPSKREWLFLAGTGIFGTLFNQVFYFTGLRQSTPANASLIIAMTPVATMILERVTAKVPLTAPKVFGVLSGVAGVLVIVGFEGKSVGASVGDLLLLLAMLTQSISLLFIRGLTKTMSSYAITIYATVLGSVLMMPAAAGEAVLGYAHLSNSVLLWLLMGAAGIVAQGMAGFWWNRGVAVVGAGTASMFMNIPPFVALLAAHFFLGDAIHLTQVVGGVLVLLGVFVANKSILRSGRRGTTSVPGITKSV